MRALTDLIVYSTLGLLLAQQQSTPIVHAEPEPGLRNGKGGKIAFIRRTFYISFCN